MHYLQKAKIWPTQEANSCFYFSGAAFYLMNINSKLTASII